MRKKIGQLLTGDREFSVLSQGFCDAIEGGEGCGAHLECIETGCATYDMFTFERVELLVIKPGKGPEAFERDMFFLLRQRNLPVLLACIHHTEFMFEDQVRSRLTGLHTQLGGLPACGGYHELDEVYTLVLKKGADASMKPALSS